MYFIINWYFTKKLITNLLFVKSIEFEEYKNYNEFM